MTGSKLTDQRRGGIADQAMRMRCMSIMFNLLVALLSLIVLSASVGCPIVPIQAGRMDAVFSYKQTYDLGSLRERDPTGTHFGPRLLTAILGLDNYCCVRKEAQDSYFRDLFERGEWRMNGSATGIISPSPWSTDGFIFEAHGRYLIQDDRRVIATADFYVEKQSVSDAKELFAKQAGDDDGHRALRWLDLLVNQIVIRAAELHGERQFVSESQIVLRLYILPLDDRGVFAIAPVRHEIGILSSSSPGDVYSMGCLEFNEPADGRKIFDVRKRDSMFRVKDYAELLRRAGIQQQSNTFRARWYGQACAASELRPRYKAAAQRSASEWQSDSDGEIFKRLFRDPSCEYHRNICPGATLLRHLGDSSNTLIGLLGGPTNTVNVCVAN
jgi:hypothetical protein